MTILARYSDLRAWHWSSTEGSAQGENDGRYFTMVLFALDTVDGRLQITSAGHSPPLLVRAGAAVELPDAAGSGSRYWTARSIPMASCNSGRETASASTPTV